MPQINTNNLIQISFKETATKILENFYQKWKSSFIDYKIFFNEAKLKSTSTQHYQLIIPCVNVKTLKKTSIFVSADLNSQPYAEKNYSISFFLPDEGINKFKTDDFNPLLLVSQFHSFYNSITCFDFNDSQYSGLTFLFDNKAELVSANMTFTMFHDGSAVRADHYVYHSSDMNVLRSNYLVRSGVENYRNFKFLWANTAIKSIMDENNFLKAYRAYITDPVRYVTLLQMEKI